jgi:hypothetical protein
MKVDIQGMSIVVTCVKYTKDGTRYRYSKFIQERLSYYTSESIGSYGEIYTEGIFRLTRSINHCGMPEKAMPAARVVQSRHHERN